jgi:hypothetical protein
LSTITNTTLSYTRQGKRELPLLLANTYLRDDCVVIDANVDYFDITVSLEPTSQQECRRVADKNCLGNVLINQLLIEYGVGAAGDEDIRRFVVAGTICPEPESVPTRRTRRELPHLTILVFWSYMMYFASPN